VFQDGAQESVLAETFGYDRSGRMLSAINDRAKVFNRYDTVGRVIETQHKHLWDGGATSNGFTTAFTYDIGASSTRTVAYPHGRSVVETLDPRGRLVGVSGGTGVGAEWEYDAADRRTKAAMGNYFHSQFNYDADNRLSSLVHYHAPPPYPLPMISHMRQYGYDAVGNRTSMLDVRWQDQSQVYKYDGRHRLTEFRRGTISGDPGAYVIKNNDLLVDAAMPGKQVWDLDRRGNWDSFETLLNGVSSTQTRTHNGANEIDAIDPDAGGQLTAVDYGVDHNGNLTLDPLAPNAGTTAPAGQRYEYDAANRLTRVWRTNDPGASDDELLLEVAYDALGRRIQSTEHIDPAAIGTPPALSQPKITVHVYVGLEPIEEYDADTNGPGAPTVTLAREFVWGAAFPEPVALIDHTNAGDIPSNGGPEVLHYLHDVLGSVIALTNSDGVVVERYDYDPYGRTYLEDASSNALVTSRYGNPFMWTGQRYDAATGQYHFWARTHSPQLGRWVQRDPYGYPDGLNSYQYAVSDPIYYTDLLGHCAGGEKPKPPKNADVVYGETSSLRPKWKDPKGDKKESNYDPESVKKLHEGRKAIAEVAEKNKKVHRDTPSEEELKDPNVRREWENAQKAAKDAEDDPNLPDDAGHFFIRKGEELNDDDGKSKPDWAKGKTPCRSYGPFRKLGSSGDVPPGDDVYIDVYCGVD